jgi:hypothetical protein
MTKLFDQPLGLHIIGARMVMALSRKSAILAVPVQARQAAPKW